MSNRTPYKSSAADSRPPTTSRLNDEQLRARIAQYDSAEACERFARNATRLARAEYLMRKAPSIWLKRNSPSTMRAQAFQG